ncbi:ABC transporter transmembrane domain-containing protein, partial [Streptococcus pneumoniae]|uniref:ABC transporter transmembrane domain-containing protein n=1 Tax=Streptococcus pneumoniae TaxID=1313 RepID=UPI00122FAF93
TTVAILWLGAYQVIDGELTIGALIAFNMLAARVLSSVAAETVSLIGKLTTVAILWLGAYQVIDGELTIGALIAFNMLAARV